MTTAEAGAVCDRSLLKQMLKHQRCTIAAPPDSSCCAAATPTMQQLQCA
eukprot:COSAG01_NODE_65516_length_273_cov_0.591954_1_plen_48_part_01